MMRVFIHRAREEKLFFWSFKEKIHVARPLILIRKPLTFFGIFCLSQKIQERVDSIINQYNFILSSHPEHYVTWLLEPSCYSNFA
jgi:hypothetical protein